MSKRVFLLILALPLCAGEAHFVERAESLGITFRHADGRSGRYYYVETTGGGAGWLDYDGDGDLDLYLISGGRTPGSPKDMNVDNALYEQRDGRFVDVTGRAGVADGAIGMGVSVADYDGDGRPDLYVTNYGANRLFRNLGDGRFEDVAERAGVAGDRWSTNSCFGDVDGDGDLDLYVANYVAFDFANSPKCGNDKLAAYSYCRPKVFKGQDDQLYINQGDGTFREESQQRGIIQKGEAKSFGALFTDLDGDGDLDILAASDGTMNRYYLNDGKGHFGDESLMSGLGYNQSGEAEAGMGMALGDVNGDLLPDLFVTNYARETNTLYINRGDGSFDDGTAQAGLALPGLAWVGWGTALFDYDNDGDLDIAVANGHVLDNIALIEDGGSAPQRNQLFENQGNGKFREITAAAGPGFAPLTVSRALAVGDWDDDGRLDLIITNIEGPAHLLHNQTKTNHHWVGFSLPYPPGTRVQLEAGDKRYQRELRAGGSYLSQDDPRLHFGLGGYVGPVTLVIHTRSGVLKKVFNELDRYHRVAP